MIRNQYNYPTPPIRGIKGKETQPRNNCTLMETSLAERQTDSYFPTKRPNGYPKQKHVSDIHIQRRTITKINQDRRTALERSVKSISVGGLKLISATSPRIQKSTNYRDKPTMRTRQHETTEMLEQKKTNSRTPVGPTTSILQIHHFAYVAISKHLSITFCNAIGITCNDTRC